MTRYAVIVDGRTAFGPFEDHALAARFAEHMTREVDPAKVATLIDPTGELLAAAGHRPAFWPPSPGEVWQDRGGDRWVCTRASRPGVSYLSCLARMADDNAEEIWRTHGPMTRVSFIPPTKAEEEAPF